MEDSSFDEEKGSSLKNGGDEGLEIAKLGIASEIVSDLVKRGITKLFPIQLINHGVSEEVIERMKADIEVFFKLPLEAKQAYKQLPGSIEGYGQAFVVSEEQQLDWADMYFLGTQPAALRNMRFWPTHPPTFRFQPFCMILSWRF